MSASFDAFYAEQIAKQLRLYPGLLARGSAAPPAFVPFASTRPLLSELNAAQRTYYAHFRHALMTSPEAIEADTGYAYLFAHELLHTPDRLPLSRTELFLRLAALPTLPQEVLRAALWWAFDASELDGYDLQYDDSAAWRVPPLHEPVHRDLALAGVARHLEDNETASDWYDVRAIIGGTPELPFDRYQFPEAFERNINRAALWAGTILFERHFGGDPIFEAFGTPPLTAVLHDTFDGLAYSGPHHSGVITRAPAYSEDDNLMGTLRALLDIGQRLVLEALGEPNMRDNGVGSGRETAFQVMAPLMRLKIHASPIARSELEAIVLHAHIPNRQRGRRVPGPRVGMRTTVAPVDTYHQQRVALHQQHLHSVPRVNGLPGSLTTSVITRFAPTDFDLYFAARLAWRERNEPIVDRNALAAYAFELLNGVGWDDPEAAYQELWKVILAHSDRLGEIPIAASTWPTLLAMRHKLKDTPARAAFRASLDWDDYTTPVRLLAAGWLHTRDFGELDLENIWPVMGFSPHRGAYFAQARDPARFLEGLVAGARAVDEHFKAMRGGSVFDVFLPQRRWTSDISASVDPTDMFGRFAQPTVRPRAPGMAAYQEFHAFMNRALSHVENRFRKAEGVAGRRSIKPRRGARADLLTPELLARIDAAIEPWLKPPKPKVRLNFDPAQVDELERRSAATRDLLVTEQTRAEAETEHAERSKPTNTTPTTAGMGETVDVGTLRSPDAELAEYLAFTAALNGLHRELLEALLTGQDRAALEQVARRHDGLLGAALEAINEHALDTLGDTIMDMTDPPTILEEHREPLRAALEEAA